MAKNIITGCMMLGILLCVQSAVGAQYDYELAYGSSDRDAGFREAVEMDDWLERGRAAVTESPVFLDGIRLTAWGGENAYEPGLASAIYYFKVPRWARYLKITIQYRDAVRDDTIAGRLWIKSADRDQYESLGAGEEAPLYGDTFVLRSERMSETIIVPRSRHIENDMVEMHIVAGGQDSLDIRDVRLVFLKTRPSNLTIVRRTYNDYWDRWPRHRYAYHYYYWGPLFWPKTYIVYECWDIPGPFYWITWRPWFFVNIIRVHHHHPWWGPRRYTVVYHMDVKHPPIKRRHLIHKRLKERHVHITKTICPKPRPRRTIPLPMPDIRPRRQEVRLQKKTAIPRKVQTTINHQASQRNPKKQPGRSIAGQAKQQSPVRPVNRHKTVQVPARKQLKQPVREIPKPSPQRRPRTRQLNQKKGAAEKPLVNTQPKIVKETRAKNKPDIRSTRSSSMGAQRIKKKQPQPRTTEQIPQNRSVAREKTVQTPIRKQFKPSEREIPKVNTEVKADPIRRPNTGQLSQERKLPERPVADKQVKTKKKPQVVNNPASHPARPRRATPQTRTSKQQPQSTSVIRETVREPTKVYATQNHRIKQGQTVQKDAKIEQGNRPQSHQETQQPRPHAEQRRPR